MFSILGLDMTWLLEASTEWLFKAAGSLSQGAVPFECTTMLARLLACNPNGRLHCIQSQLNRICAATQRDLGVGMLNRLLPSVNGMQTNLSYAVFD